MKVAIIGGGAAGFFAAITAKETHPEAEIVIFEKSKKWLSKVKVSGGGRCNVTNVCTSISKLCEAYPRGGKSMKKLFSVFSTQHAMKWFEQRGVPLVVQPDGCVFPQSQNSQSIIDCLTQQARILNIHLKNEHCVSEIIPGENQLTLIINPNNPVELTFDKVIVTTGGSPKHAGLIWLEKLGHQIESPVPSLFSFNLNNQSITELSGIVIDPVQVSIPGEKVKTDGALLITHRGLSGPAILKLSSMAARVLNACNYKFSIAINWANNSNCEDVAHTLEQLATTNGSKLLGNLRPFGLPDRLWNYLIEKKQIPTTKRWNELGKKGINKLTNILTNDTYRIEDQSTHKEEFVTCGGVSLLDVDLNTLQSKRVKNLYFAGEVLDIDAITGGYNLQAAWTTGFIAGQLKNITA
jgi:predicted Rossmann fold flavoprotein